MVGRAVRGGDMNARSGWRVQCTNRRVVHTGGMDSGLDKYLAIVQTAAVLVAVGGLIVALTIASKDRRNANESALRDRELARWEAERRHRLDLLVRLSTNLNKGGSTNASERQWMGAEAAALTTALGPEVIPQLFAQRGDMEDARAEIEAIDPQEWNWAQRAASVDIALHDLATEPTPAL